ncbi:T9SS type A sorting domain-containing protein [Hymenobacter properus]|uniref:T9SS type A sorting domain-containing protein n=1 Tax=Hymenobacter properus TaxID=2791026 RepID=A0A931FKS0_9BACT|nr:T9SS type A sorting domain-containing protein [Hymenobacter properus]MBF9141301.1 T9SS type A sorting domain-containing protein [Hymenobacter properus]MBR7720111.1 T9SS type A sorting domain-containing protein [Microvirga sp. SRT04]
MKKSFLLIMPVVGMSYGATAQKLSPELISSAGGSSGGAGVLIDWSLGEVAVETVAAPATLYTQGFHQPSLQVTALTKEPGNTSALLFSAAPNPVESLLTVFMPADLQEAVQLSLSDASGKVLLTQSPQLHQLEQQLNLVDFAAGVYFLHVRGKRGNALQTFKIIKAQ